MDYDEQEKIWNWPGPKYGITPAPACSPYDSLYRLLVLVCTNITIFAQQKFTAFNHHENVWLYKCKHSSVVY
jgi:hypothetical protein